jgi:hypothetical protein
VARSRVELFEQIRRDQKAESTSIRELAVRHGVHRRTVRQALASAVPPPRKDYRPRRCARSRSDGARTCEMLASGQPPACPQRTYDRKA